ncbi:MAG: phosphoribosylformylglycinamidine synthase I [bacterium]|nr:phosphoribosylformylglycinamidine synthase I [bacterium]
MKARPEIGVLFTEGTNCDHETIEALEAVSAAAERVHVSEVEAGGQDLGDYEALVIPGGFSYGDDIASGKVLAVELETQLADQLRDFTERDEKPVIGICNGFQVLVRSGLLPEGSIDAEQRVTLAHNDSDRFECRWVRIGYEADNNCVFLEDMPDSFMFQARHGEGRLVVPSEELRELKENRQIVFQYTDAEGRPTESYPANPNGSAEGITGITDRRGRILGMMPHPERSIEPRQHPHYDRIRINGGSEPLTPGRQVFEQLVGYVRNG